MTHGTQFFAIRHSNTGGNQAYHANVLHPSKGVAAMTSSCQQLNIKCTHHALKTYNRRGSEMHEVCMRCTWACMRRACIMAPD